MPISHRLERRIDAFQGQIEFGVDLLARLASDGFTVTHVKSVGSWDSQQSWLLRALPPDHVVARFDLAPEIQLVVTRNEVQARDLDRALKEAAKARSRLNVDLVVVASPMKDLEGHLLRLPPATLEDDPIVQQRVPWSWSTRRLSEEFARRLPLTDLFDVSDPVHLSGFFGRTSEVAELTTQLSRGGGVGVFGLRKVGKTTLARRVQKNMEAAGWRCAWVDAQGLARGKRNGNGVAARWAQQLPGEWIDGSPIDVLIGRLERNLDEERPVLLTVDEFDLLFENVERGETQLELFERLRALSQAERAAPLAVMFIGRDPKLLSPPLLWGYSNPLLAWVRDTWVGPLRKTAAKNLLRRLGKRSNLNIGHLTWLRAWDWTHGHPHLHRQFGSAALSVMKKVQDKDYSSRWKTDEHLKDIERAFRRRNRCREIGSEVVQLLDHRYPRAYKLLFALVHAASGDSRMRLWQAGGNGDLGPSEILRQFGLVDEDVKMAKFWEWYVTTFYPREESAVG